ncbi:uncharacterized protein LOC110183990 [Drosophila serrata]|uniref:uncharacterized protein LOC110183990 n=1 Tax=Drosophila serrata TaxID=7274 RepID=UPI000A1D26EE|nr:uncharacterized protein LOC110183990 [Drosophila serrata]
MIINTIFLVIILQILYRYGNARPIPLQRPPIPVQINKSNFTKNIQIERTNITKNGSMDAIEQNSLFNEFPMSAAILNYTIRHIARKKRITETGKENENEKEQEKEDEISPEELLRLHTPCDMDLAKVNDHDIPPNCRSAHDSRFDSKQNFKVFRLYQIEAFMFGQHYERFRRFETEQHTFDYKYSIMFNSDSVYA